MPRYLIGNPIFAIISTVGRLMNSLDLPKKRQFTLWRCLTTGDDDDPDIDFPSLVRYRTEESPVNDATCIEDDWIACMDGLRINPKLQNAITLSEFEDLSESNRELQILVDRYNGPHFCTFTFDLHSLYPQLF